MDDPEATRERRDRKEEAVEKPLSLNEQRLTAVLAALRASGAASGLDLGCGEKRLLSLLQSERAFTLILGLDVSPATLQVAAWRLHYDRFTKAQRARLGLVQGSLLYRDKRPEGFDAAALVELLDTSTRRDCAPPNGSRHFFVHSLKHRLWCPHLHGVRHRLVQAKLVDKRFGVQGWHHAKKLDEDCLV